VPSSLAVFAFVLGGVIAIFTALSASELGTAMPKSGGAYYYVNHALGPLFGSIAGWANWIGLAFASAFYMYGFGEYINSFVGLSFEVSLGVSTVGPAKVIALAGAGFFILVNYVGAKETGRLQNFIVLTLVLILTGFSVIGLLNADTSQLFPLVREGKPPSQLLPVTGLVFVSYLGFVQITSVAEEIKDPGRNLPRAVIGSVLIVTTIYALVLLIVLAAVENSVIAGNNTAVVDVARTLVGPVGAAVMLFAGLLATASSANASVLASSRINFAMGRDGIVSKSLNKIHDRFGTPYRSIGITGGLVLGFIVFGNLELLASVGSALHLVIYGLLNLALIVMRVADPEEYAPDYTVPLYPIVPILGAILSFALLVYISPAALLLTLGLVVGAALWYLFYARTRATKQGILGNYILQRSEDMPEPAVSAATSVQPDGGDFRVMVPLANPDNEQELITLASAVAKRRGGSVHAVHIVQVPDQTSLKYAEENLDKFDANTDIVEDARADAETYDVPVETHTVISHRSFEEVFDAAETYDADMVVMGWGPHSHDGRAESRLDQLTHDVPCDFVVLRDRGFDASRILVPTAGGPSSGLAAELAGLLQAEFDSEVTLLHALSADETREEAASFLSEWAADYGLADANQVVIDADVETAIGDAAEDHSMLLIGATERGLLSRLVRGSLVLDVVEEVDCSVVLTEKARGRSLRERLFG
jgi:amino acid transporter/nucleotide-binding universal stress UspA family protein